MELRRKGLELSDKWIIIEDYKKYPALKNIAHDFQGEDILGYVYIDHEAGITLEIIKFLSRSNDEIIFGDGPLDKNMSLKIRYGQFIDTEFIIQEAEAIGSYRLSTPDAIKLYDRPDLKAFRNTTIIDNYRAEGYPDDIQILVITERDEIKPEMLWARVIAYDSVKKIGHCQVLVKPHQNIGVHKDETIGFVITEIEGEHWILGIIEEQPATTKKKAWWKFW